MWLWDTLLPGFRDWDQKHWLVGVGTVLSVALPSPPSYLVIGSGVGYGTIPKNREDWEIRCVRGPKSAKALGLPANAGIIDPAALISRLTEITPSRGSGRDVFIPHCDSDLKTDYDWPEICAAADMDYLSPRGESKAVIAAIAGAKRIITESMHGAILADAFRVPWHPVSLVHDFNDFKWRDWGESLELSFEITPLPRHVQDLRHRISKFRSRAKPAPSPAPSATISVTPKASVPKSSGLLTQTAHRIQAALTVRTLKAVQKGQFYLSDDRILADRLDLFEEELHRIRQSYS